MTMTKRNAFPKNAVLRASAPLREKKTKQYRAETQGRREKIVEQNHLYPICMD
jgi:hypothetical protein